MIYDCVKIGAWCVQTIQNMYTCQNTCTHTSNILFDCSIHGKYTNPKTKSTTTKKKDEMTKQCEKPNKNEQNDIEMMMVDEDRIRDGALTYTHTHILTSLTRKIGN